MALMEMSAVGLHEPLLGSGIQSFSGIQNQLCMLVKRINAGDWNARFIALLIKETDVLLCAVEVQTT